MNTPLFASGVTQNSRSISKSEYDEVVSRNPVPESAATAPSCKRQLASPTCVQPARLLPSSNVRQVSPTAGLGPCSVPGTHPEAATAMTTTVSFARINPPECRRLGDELLSAAASSSAELSSTRQRTLFESERCLKA